MQDEHTSSLSCLKAAVCAQPPPMFCMLRFAPKIRLLAPSAAPGCGEPSSLRVQFWESLWDCQSTNWGLSALWIPLLYIYPTLYTYIFLIDIYVSYSIDILLWHHDCLPRNTKLEQFLQLSVIWVKVKNPFFLFLLRTVTEKVLPDMERGSESCG